MPSLPRKADKLSVHILSLVFLNLDEPTTTTSDYPQIRVQEVSLRLSEPHKPYAASTTNVREQVRCSKDPISEIHTSIKIRFQ